MGSIRLLDYRRIAVRLVEPNAPVTSGEDERNGSFAQNFGDRIAASRPKIDVQYGQLDSLIRREDQRLLEVHGKYYFASGIQQDVLRKGGHKALVLDEQHATAGERLHCSFQSQAAEPEAFLSASWSAGLAEGRRRFIAQTRPPGR